MNKVFENTIFKWGDADVTPVNVFCDLWGIDIFKLREVFMDKSGYFGENNYAIVPENEIYKLIGNQYKHHFDPMSDTEIVCIDRTLALILVVNELDEYFSYKGLRRVK